MNGKAILIAALGLAIAPEMVGAFSTSSAITNRLSIGGRASVRATSALRMQEEGAAAAEEPEKVLNRAAKRAAAKDSKKTTSGAPKTMTQSAGGIRQNSIQAKQAKQAVKSKLVEVCAVDDIGAADGSAKTFEITEANPPKVVMMLRHKGAVLAVQPGCTKCKLPLMGADIDNTRIRCKLCGSAWKLPGGEVMEGTEGTMMSGLFASTPQTTLPVFATKVAQGKVYLGIAV